jgi:hypothetical protein
MDLAKAVARLLGLDPPRVTLSPVNGGCSSARTAKVTVRDQDGDRFYFVKYAAGEDARVMFLGPPKTRCCEVAKIPQANTSR